MSRSVTQTSVTHYEVQNKRRAAVVEEARRNRPAPVIHLADAPLEDNPARRMRRGVYLGADGGRPTKVLDSHVHEIPEQTTSTIHRHSWDAIMFVTDGSGWTEIDGQRIEWRPWDTVYIPRWAWHRHGNLGDKPARFVTWSVAPMYEAFGFAVLEDAGDEPYVALPPPPTSAPFTETGADSYSRRRRRMSADRVPPSGAYRVQTKWEDVNPRVTKRGARSMFLVDESIGYRTSGLSAVMHELAPARWQARHRHGGEAYLYVVTGEGHSEVDGVDYPWSAGDLVVVDHWCWHAHFNDDKKRSSRLIRVHNNDALYDLMRVLLDPLELIEELPDLHDAPDLTGFVWPDPNAGRPAF
jgi:quercetin dioxygenase-like cupin family protein